MVNLFDLSTGVPGNRPLMDKPHHNGSPLSRTQSDVSEMSPIGDHTEDKGVPVCFYFYAVKEIVKKAKILI
ncbi:hypothetical protein LguiB_027406 [Lonicera macranthoides]